MITFNSFFLVWLRELQLLHRLPKCSAIIGDISTTASLASLFQLFENYIYDKNILKTRDTSRCPKVDITGILNVFFFTSVAQMTLYNHYEQTSASKLELFDHYENKTSNMLTVCQHCYSSASAARILDILSQRYML